MRIEASQDLTANIFEYSTGVLSIRAFLYFMVHDRQFRQGGTTRGLGSLRPSHLACDHLCGEIFRGTRLRHQPHAIPVRKCKTCTCVSFLSNPQHAALTILAANSSVPRVELPVANGSLRVLCWGTQFRLNFNHREQFCSINRSKLVPYGCGRLCQMDQNKDRE